jgi:hypothetical protein
MAKLTTKKLMVYYIYFQLESVVEEGWIRIEEEYIMNFDEMVDNLSHEFQDVCAVTGSNLSNHDRTAHTLHVRSREQVIYIDGLPRVGCFLKRKPDKEIRTRFPVAVDPLRYMLQRREDNLHLNFM